MRLYLGTDNIYRCVQGISVNDLLQLAGLILCDCNPHIVLESFRNFICVGGHGADTVSAIYPV
jgi:hypothetical protein